MSEMIENRDAKIVRTSIIGILANIALAGFKAVVGLLSGSIAIVLDAVNNLSDALSSVITIIGTKLAGKAPDQKHPYGYGRVEYMSAMIISVIVLYAGITSFTESVKKIITPETPDYSAVALIIVAAGVLVKIILGRYVKSVGVKVHSDSLINSGEDATLDSIISASTLVAAFIFLFFHLSLEAWLGAVISIVIIKSGIEMLRDTLSRILGERASGELSKAIKKTALSVDGVQGVYDLVLHDYGPDRMMGSLHVEVPDTFTADRMDQMTRQIEEKVFLENHVILTAVGFYSINTKNDADAKIRDQIREMVMSHEEVLQMHGFYIDHDAGRIRFDLVIDFMAGDRKKKFDAIVNEVRKAYPDYRIVAAMDTNTSD
jgi:cation diffusion facilitator family transporter